VTIEQGYLTLGADLEEGEMVKLVRIDSTWLSELLGIWSSRPYGLTERDIFARVTVFTRQLWSANQSLVPDRSRRARRWGLGS
jgi:hypothetical protein